ncbi:MAG: S49 family peptidase [Nitratireductor sp.]|nr:S49 family peptidase [Nitratireductor sp.]
MSFAHAQICAQLFDQPHLYHPGKAAAFIRALGPELTGHQITIVNGADEVDHVAFANGRPSAGVIGDRLGRAYDRAGYPPFDMIGNVAIIPVEGTLVQKGAWLGSSSGETSYQGLNVQIARARSREDVKGVVFEIDSFGGQGNGVFETAENLRQLSKEKPTLAILTDYAYSAGYALACNARAIAIPEFGGAGSIGVVMMHADFSGKLGQDGVAITFVYSGAHKVDGHPFLPLPEETKARWQAGVDAMRDRFAQVVGLGRGKRFTKAAALKTEALDYDAADALKLGLVDEIAKPQDVFADFLKQINGRH